MSHKKRGYKRETPEDLFRDYKLFAIACEGQKTEPNYFKVFRLMSRKLKVDIIDYEEDDRKGSQIGQLKSAPKWVLDKAVKYIEDEGLIDEDSLWFVLDVDRWESEQLRNIAQWCAEHPNWHIVLSNPCFEVWLYYHKKANIAVSDSQTCHDFKHEISTFDKGGYHPYKYVPYLTSAIANAKAAESDPDHYFPVPKETKVYLLGEALLEEIGRKSYEDFLNNHLPILIEEEIKKFKVGRHKK